MNNSKLSLLKLLMIIAVAAGLSSCGPEPTTPDPTPADEGDLLISNEGNFGWGEGTLSIYNPSDKTIYENAFKNANTEAMGNVFHSINYINNQYYFVVNNSNKIVIANDSFQEVNTIDNLTSPRYVFPVSESKAYVTDLFSGAIHILNLNTQEKTGEIPLAGWTEGGVLINDEFWVCNVMRDHIYIIDISTDTVKDSIEVTYAPESCALTNDSTVYVLCQGSSFDTIIAPSLVAINPITKSKNETIALTGRPSKLQYYAKGNKLYYLNSDVFEVDAIPNANPVALITKNAPTLYGLTVNQNNGEIYFSDALDYASESDVFRYSNSGELIDEFKAGIIAGNFWWR